MKGSACEVHMSHALEKMKKNGNLLNEFKNDEGVESFISLCFCIGQCQVFSLAFSLLSSYLVKQNKKELIEIE